ncbi:hypothetical protein CDAR_53881 [Caerostris darwini]|uniref:Uncharacterized protein n=1 Tax=Caerostris darwini TaxID=1538125 RepID=A0AAV4WGZ9_9ARAC|nr:hypothetical protein CDAR_53881 [Caerostris darwini]
MKSSKLGFKRMNFVKKRTKRTKGRDETGTCMKNCPRDGPLAVGKDKRTLRRCKILTRVLLRVSRPGEEIPFLQSKKGLLAIDP